MVCVMGKTFPELKKISQGLADRAGIEYENAARIVAQFSSVGEWAAVDAISAGDIKTIKESAFENSKMTIAYIPDGCQTISAYAFKNCKQLTQISQINSALIADCGFLQRRRKISRRIFNGKPRHRSRKRKEKRGFGSWDGFLFFRCR